MAIAPLMLVPVNLVLIILYLIARNKQDLKRTVIIQPLTKKRYEDVLTRITERNAVKE